MDEIMEPGIERVSSEDEKSLWDVVTKFLAEKLFTVLSPDGLRTDAVIRRCHGFAQKLWIIRNAAKPRTAKKQLRNVIHSPLVIESFAWEILQAIHDKDDASKVKEIIAMFFGNSSLNIAIPQNMPLRVQSLEEPTGKLPSIQIVKCLFHPMHIIMPMQYPTFFEKVTFYYDFDIKEFASGYKEAQIRDYVAAKFQKHKEFHSFLKTHFLQSDVPDVCSMVFVSAISLNIEFPIQRKTSEFGPFTLDAEDLKREDRQKSVRKVTFTRHVKYAKGSLQAAAPNDPFIGGIGGTQFEAVGIDITIEGNNLVLMIICPTGDYKPDNFEFSHLERLIAQFYPGKYKCPEFNLFPTILDNATEKWVKISLPVFSVRDKFCKLREAFQLMGMQKPFEMRTNNFKSLMVHVGTELPAPYCLDRILHAANLRIHRSNRGGNCFTDNKSVPSDVTITDFDVSRPFFFAVIYAEKYILLHGAIHDFNFLEVEGETDRADPFMQDDEIRETEPIELEKFGSKSETSKGSKKGTPIGSPMKIQMGTVRTQQCQPGTSKESPAKKLKK